MMKKFYITFGQSHVHSINDVIFDKDCVAMIEAENHGAARNRAFELFGSVFATSYTEEPDMKFFPRGIIHVD